MPLQWRDERCRIRLTFENLGRFNLTMTWPKCSDMIRRSVPGYGQMVGKGLLAARYAQSDSH